MLFMPIIILPGQNLLSPEIYNQKALQEILTRLKEIMIEFKKDPLDQEIEIDSGLIPVEDETNQF